MCAIDRSGLIAGFAVQGAPDTAAMVFLTEILLPTS